MCKMPSSPAAAQFASGSMEAAVEIDWAQGRLSLLKPTTVLPMLKHHHEMDASRPIHCAYISRLCCSGSVGPTMHFCSSSEEEGRPTIGLPDRNATTYSSQYTHCKPGNLFEPLRIAGLDVCRRLSSARPKICSNGTWQEP